MKVKDKYKKYLQIRTGIDKYNTFKSILYSPKDTLTEILFRNHISKLKFTDELSICDVGGGDGKRIIELVNGIKTLVNSRIHLDFIEQSDLMCSDFSATAEQIKDFCEIQIYTKEIEDSFLSNTYDIVFLIHSIFCFSNFSVFEKIFSRVKENGVLYVVSNSSSSFLSKLKKKLDSQYEDERYEINNLVSDIKVSGLKYSKYNFKTAWKLTNQDVDNKIASILEWLSLGEFQSFSTSKQLQIIEFAKSLAVKVDNEYIFSEDEIILEIIK